MKNLKSKVQNHSVKFKRKSGLDGLKPLVYSHGVNNTNTRQLKLHRKKLSTENYISMAEFLVLTGIAVL